MTSSIQWEMRRLPDEYNEDGTQKAVLSLTLSNGEPVVVPTTSRHYKTVLQAIAEAEANGEVLDEERIQQITSIAFSAGEQLRNLSKRVQFDGKETIYFDGDPVNGKIAENLISLARAGKPVDSLVKFLEKAAMNRSQESLNQLYDFIDRHGLTLTPEGNVIAYKGVMLENDDPSKPVSIHAGPGIVDGVTYEHAHLPNHKGARVSIPRSYVDTNQNVGCSRGLHVGTYDYASGFAQGMLLTCEFDPADAMSVPHDCSYQKIRVQSYNVLDVTEKKWEGPLYGDDAQDSWDDDDYYEDEDLREWYRNGIDEEDAINFIDQGYSLDEALAELEDEENGDSDDSSENGSDDEQVDGQTSINIDAFIFSASDEDETENVAPSASDVRSTQDQVVNLEASGLDVTRIKLKDNADGTLRRATLILKGDKKSRNRVHLYFGEDGQFDRRVVDKD